MRAAFDLVFDVVFDIDLAFALFLTFPHRIRSFFPSPFGRGWREATGEGGF